jgi:predicted ATPase
MLGYSEQARAQAEDALALIGRHTQSVFVAHGLIHCCMPFMLFGDVDAVRKILAQARPLVIETANPDQLGTCDFALGWTHAFEEEYADGITLMERGLASRPPDVARYYNCYYQSVIAVACYRNGQFEKGQNHLRQALEEANATGERWWEAELHRLDGHAHLLSNGAHPDSARDSFQKALQVSRAQGAKMLELRAATDLARLLRDQGARQEAVDLLTPVYEWFTEGFETADLRTARDLLEEFL